MDAEVTLNYNIYDKKYRSTLEIINCVCPAPIYPRSGARTIDDFESWTVILEIYVFKKFSYFPCHLGYLNILDFYTVYLQVYLRAGVISWFQW